jgi:hypothetical protein
VVSEFGLGYGATHPTIVTEALNEVPKIAKGLEELKASVPTSCGDGGYRLKKSEDWIYSQAPQFTFSTENFREAPGWSMPYVSLTLSSVCYHLLTH